MCVCVCVCLTQNRHLEWKQTIQIVHNTHTQTHTQTHTHTHTDTDTDTHTVSLCLCVSVSVSVSVFILNDDCRRLIMKLFWKGWNRRYYISFRLLINTVSFIYFVTLDLLLLSWLTKYIAEGNNAYITSVPSLSQQIPSLTFIVFRTRVQQCGDTALQSCARAVLCTCTINLYVHNCLPRFLHQ